MNFPYARFMAMMVVFILSLCLASCATITPIHDYCQLAKPILLARGEAATLSDESAKEILAHNDTWKAICK